jgi:type I restriction enzyme M protein
MANPPFMTPKGGVVPHTKFRIAAKKAEVLFTDYIAEHLTTNGRAGIIVPEGIIFQSGTAYKALRKFLVEDCLVAVISLPAGVFNPYSGVKTSILILDKGLARQTDSIAFFKVENDGYDLGAQRRAIDKNDLPGLIKEIHDYLEKLRTGKKIVEKENMQLISKEKISANGEFNLGGERYRDGVASLSAFDQVRLDEVFTRISNGVNVSQADEQKQSRNGDGGASSGGGLGQPLRNNPADQSRDQTGNKDSENHCDDHGEFEPQLD